MRLLQLDNSGGCSLSRFPKNRIPPYAILSHTWGEEDDEVTFQDMMDNTGREKKGFQKLLFCGNQAKTDSLQYFWVDTCCIDKSNSTELQTAINSMYRWYQNSAKCYVWLSDVMAQEKSDQSDPVEDWEAAFRNSRWFTRGWTLQELLAPRSVAFYSCDHVHLGDKTSLEQTICEVTRIAVKALQGDNLSDFSIDERLQWRNARQTTEEEDRAYCLLGIFDISMPLVYGEGYDKAMKRLLREIEESTHSKYPTTGAPSVRRAVLAMRRAQNEQQEISSKKLLPQQTEEVREAEKTIPPVDTQQRPATAEVPPTVQVHEQEAKPPSPKKTSPVVGSKYHPRTIVDRSTLLFRKPKNIGKGSHALGNALVAAAKGRKSNVVEQLLDRGVDPNSKGPPDGHTALFEATRVRDAGCMKLLLDFGADPNIDENLMTAAFLSFLDGVRLLLEHGARPNYYKARFNAMNWACDHHDVEMASALVRFGASGDDRNKDGTTNLCYASGFQTTSIVEALLAYGCDVNLKSSNHWNPLNYAISKGSLGNTKLLLEYGVNPLLEGPDYPLSLACSRNYPEILKALLNSNITYPDECTKDAVAKAAENIECLKVLLDTQRLQIPREFMENALPRARNHPDCLRLLTSHGADVTKSKGLLEEAVWARNIESVEVILDNGCDINEHGVVRYGNTSQTALARACEFGLDDIVALLLSRGADPNAKATSYPLWKACKFPSVLEKLFAAGADISKTPGIVAYAVWESKNAESITKLLDGGGDLNDTYRWGYELPATPLSVAAKHNISSIVSLLLAEGADPNLNGYMLPIFGAAVHADSTVLKSLIEAGADVNQPSQDCWQPKDYALRIACEKGLVDNVRLLLEAGADLNATNSKGARAVDAAAGSGHDDLLMMLLDSE